MMRHYPITTLFLGTIALTQAIAAEKHYGPGVSDTEIKIGQTVPYSGPASFYGPFGLVQQAYYRMLNEQGGVNGRKITLISLDNGYSPPKALEAVRELVERDKVFALAGNFGTLPNIGTKRYLNDAKVPSIFMISGAGQFNDPQHFPWIVPLLTQFPTEGRMWARYLLATRPRAKIAVLYEDDDLGRDLFSGFRAGLGGTSDQIVRADNYHTTDPTIDSQIVSLQASGADTITEFATPKFAGQAARKIYDLGWRPFQIMSFPAVAGLSALRVPGPEKTTGIVTTEPALDPSDPGLANDADIMAYKDFVKQHWPSGDPDSNLSMGGYANALLFTEVLRRCGDELTREHLLDVVTHLHGAHLLGGFPGTSINYSPTDYDALKHFQLFRWDGKQLVAFGNLIND